jgi:4-hydroxy-tetrahydrodipicolinate reductase
VSPAKVLIGIDGALGRMGVQLIAEDPALKLAAALERDGHPQLGDDAGKLAGVAPMGVPLSRAVPDEAAIDVMVDFTSPSAAMVIGEWCRRRGVALVVGTTGFSQDQRAALESASDRIPILISPNMSRAVNLLMRLAGEAARVFGRSADIEIIERHHRTKKDAPSGTALRLAEIAGHGRSAGRLVSTDTGHPAARAEGEIGIHALRIADSPGEHTVVFGLMGETLELSHRALNRDGFARGALDAAKFLAGKPAGLYSMEDVLA